MEFSSAGASPRPTIFIDTPCRGEHCSPDWRYEDQLIFATTLGTLAMITAAMAVKTISGIMYIPL